MRAKLPTPADRLGELRRDIYQDVFAAAESLYRIEMRDGSGLEYAALWRHQQVMFSALLGQRQRRQPPRLLALKTRRAGTSTASALWTFHEVYWRPRRHGLVVSHRDETTAVLYAIYRTLYEELPGELQQPLQKLNRKEIACEAPWGSSISAQTAGYVDIARGPTLQHVHLSEIDYYGDPERTLDGIFNAVTMHPETSIIIESTARGADGWLAHFWKESRRGKTGYVPVFQPWFAVPEHAIEPDPDYEFSREDREWMKEFSLGPAQVFWYRRKLQETIAKEPWGGERKMRQEYPFTEQEAFQASGFCVFPDVVLAAQAQHAQPPRACYQLKPTGGGQHVLLPVDEERADLFVWEEPQEDTQYSHGIDIGGGVGRTESVISIWRYPGYVQVAEWANKHTSVDGTAFAARWLGEFYGGSKALLVPEVNKDGPMILYILQGLPGSYEIFRWRYLDKVAPFPSDNPRLGWETSGVTKNLLAQAFNMIFMRGLHGTGEGIVRSATLVEQMRRCLDVLPGKRWTAVGGLSDRIIAALIAIMGAYLEFEGGTVSLQGLATPGVEGDKPAQWREPGVYDDAEGIFEDVMGRPMGQPREDFE